MAAPIMQMPKLGCAPAGATWKGRAHFTEKMRAGEVVVPFVKLRDHAANFLTNSAFAPDSKIPEYKVCAVRIEKVHIGKGIL